MQEPNGAILREWLSDATEVERLCALGEAALGEMQRTASRPTAGAKQAPQRHTPTMMKEKPKFLDKYDITGILIRWWLFLFVLFVMSYYMLPILIAVAAVLGPYIVAALLSILAFLLALIPNIIRYRSAVSKYNADFAEANSRADKEYEQAFASWQSEEAARQASNNQLLAVKKALEPEIARVKSTLEGLYEQRRRIYSTGSLAREYQTLQAVAAMGGYLETGRCERLYGHGGAIDTFAHDAQLSLITSKLDVIIRKLDDIRYSQVCLYRAVQENNQELGKIRGELGQLASAQTATAAASTSLVAIESYNANCLREIERIQRKAYYKSL